MDTNVKEQIKDVLEQSIDAEHNTQTGLALFESEEFGRVRIAYGDNGEPWFVARDIVEALEYAKTSITSLSKLLAPVPDQWKGKKPFLTPGGEQYMLCLSEPGMYFFVNRSDKPKSIPFQMWVAGTVLPSIRRTGGYIHVKKGDTLDMIAERCAAVSEDTINRVKGDLNLKIEHITKLKDKIRRDRPKVALAESIEAAEDSLSVGECSKLIAQSLKVETGPNRFFAWLRENGYVHKRGAQHNLPTQRSIENEWMRIVHGIRLDDFGNEKPTKTTKITRKGQAYFLNQFRKMAMLEEEDQ